MKKLTLIFTVLVMFIISSCSDEEVRPIDESNDLIINDISEGDDDDDPRNGPNS